jgi:5'-nucleotidase
VSTVKVNGVNLDLNKTYTVATNSYLTSGTGGDNFTVMATQGKNISGTKLDIDAIKSYFKDKSPVAVPTSRITCVN